MGIFEEMSFADSESYGERRERELKSIPSSLLPLLKKIEVEDDWEEGKKKLSVIKWAFTQISVKSIKELSTYTRPFIFRKVEKRATRWGPSIIKKEEWRRFFLLLKERPKELPPGDYYQIGRKVPGEHYAPPVGKSPNFGKIAIVELKKNYSNISQEEIDSRCMTIYLP